MKALRTSAAACLCAGAALAITSPATTACGGKCELPDERIELSFPDFIEKACVLGSGDVGTVIDASVSNEGDDLVLTKGEARIAIPALHAKIPDGTLVRVTLFCGSLPGFPVARLLAIDNLPEIDGQPNPTESGERSWLFVAAGGPLPFLGGLPFDFALEEQCEVTTNNGRRKYGVEALVLASDKDVVYVPSGETRPFTVHRGPQAGSYTVENVNITFQDTGIPLATNLRIDRAD